MNYIAVQVKSLLPRPTIPNAKYLCIVPLVITESGSGSQTPHGAQRQRRVLARRYGGE